MGSFVHRGRRTDLNPKTQKFSYPDQFHLMFCVTLAVLTQGHLRVQIPPTCQQGSSTDEHNMITPVPGLGRAASGSSLTARPAARRCRSQPAGAAHGEERAAQELVPPDPHRPGRSSLRGPLPAKPGAGEAPSTRVGLALARAIRALPGVGSSAAPRRPAAETSPPPDQRNEETEPPPRRGHAGVAAARPLPAGTGETPPRPPQPRPRAGPARSPLLLTRGPPPGS